MDEVASIDIGVCFVQLLSETFFLEHECQPEGVDVVGLTDLSVGVTKHKMSTSFAPLHLLRRRQFPFFDTVARL